MTKLLAGERWLNAHAVEATSPRTLSSLSARNYREMV